MTENSNVQSLVGGEVKVLNDMVGSVTVSAWREQAERAAVRLCGETGKMMLHGTFPSVRAGTYYDKQLLIDTLMDLFKSTRHGTPSTMGAAEHVGASPQMCSNCQQLHTRNPTWQSVHTGRVGYWYTCRRKPSTHQGVGAG